MNGLAADSGTNPQVPAPLQPAVNFAGNALSQIAGHQDLLPILGNAQARDEESGRTESFLDLIRDPHSYTSQAWKMYLHNPSAAMDEYGLGSPQQAQWMTQHGHGARKGTAEFMQRHPLVNAVATFGSEMANPMAWVEGLGAGKVLGALGGVVRGTKLERAGQAMANAVGFGSPLYPIANRGGTPAVNWVNSLLHAVHAPEKFIDASGKTLPSTEHLLEKVFGGLTPEEQNEVIALRQGEKPDPKFFKQYNDLKKRADLLRSDTNLITKHRLRVGTLKPEQVNQKFFPMKNSYEFQPGYTIEGELRNEPRPGASSKKPKTYQTIRESMNAKVPLKSDFLGANNYANYRKAALKEVAFEDALNRAPASLRLPSNKGLRKRIIQGGGQINGQEYRYAANPLKMPSPALRRGAAAPELLDFIDKDEGLRRYLGVNPGAPGQESNTFMGRVGALYRTMIVGINPLFHPAVNIAGRESAARSLANIGGPRFEFGGYLYNAARAVAQQAGVDPARFVGGAKQYTTWLDRALKAGTTGEIGMPPKSALGGERARVLTVPPQNWRERVDKFFTKFGSANRERTFGSKGEESFAVSLFKDAVEKGHMSDVEAGALTRQAMHDLYNFDPKSQWGYLNFFMPWRKGNWKFWSRMLAERPHTVTGPAHAIRNYNEQTAPDQMQGPFPRPSFQVQNNPLFGGLPGTVPFVGRDVDYIANIAGALATPRQSGPGPVIDNAERLLLGSENPVVRLLQNAHDTNQAQYSTEVEGPETNPNLLFNPKAPPDKQYTQLFHNLEGRLPVPLVSFAFQKMMQHGASPQDIQNALATGAGLGYAGNPRLTSTQRRQVGTAKNQYRKAYYRYLYDTHDDQTLQEAWSKYEEALRKAGVIH